MTIKTEGTVNLSINELDNLRNQISDLIKERDDLKLHSKEVKLNILVEEEYLTTRSVDDWEAFHDADSGKYSRYHFGQIPQKLVAVKNKHIISENDSYIGLDEVIKELRQQEEAKVITKLGELDRQIISLRNREEDLRTKQAKDLQELRKRQTEEIKEINTKHDNIVKDLNKTINDLNGVITDQTKDDTIRQLKGEIELLKLKKGFWGFLHN